MRNQLRGRASSLAALVVLAAAVVGCGSGAPSVAYSDEEATVTGKVSVSGKAASAGEVTFDASNISRSGGTRSAPIGKDGTYTIKTLVGVNKVAVRGPAVDKDVKLQYNEQEYDVQKGSNTFDIAVTKK